MTAAWIAFTSFLVPSAFMLGMMVSRFLLEVKLDDIDRRLDALNEAERNVRAVCRERGHEYEWDDRGPGGYRCVRCGSIQ